MESQELRSAPPEPASQESNSQSGADPSRPSGPPARRLAPPLWVLPALCAASIATAVGLQRLEQESSTIPPPDPSAFVAEQRALGVRLVARTNDRGSGDRGFGDGGSDSGSGASSIVNEALSALEHPPAEAIAAQLDLSKLSLAWRRAAEALVRNRDIRTAQATLDEHVGEGSALVAQMLINADELAQRYIADEAQPRVVYLLSRQLMLLQRMQAQLERIARAGPGLIGAADQVGRDAIAFNEVNSGLLNGNRAEDIEPTRDEDVRGMLEAVGRQFRELSAVVEDLVGAASTLATYRAEGREAASTLAQVLREVEALGASPLPEVNTNFDQSASLILWVEPLTYVALALAVLAAGLGLFVNRRNARLAAAEFLAAYQREAQYRERTVFAEQQASRARDELRRITRELSAMVGADLTLPREPEAQSIPVLAAALDTVVGQLRSRLRPFREQLERALSAGQEMDQALRRLHVAGEQQLRKVDETADATRTLAQQVKLVSNDASRVERISERRGDLSPVAHTLDNAVTQLESVNGSTRVTARWIRKVNQCAHRAGKLSDDLERTAQKSKMISLNLALRASNRAEDSDGFDELAEEICALASHINRLGTELGRDADEAASAVKRTVWDASQATERARRARDTLSKLSPANQALVVHSENLAGTYDRHALQAAEVVRGVTAVHALSDHAQTGLARLADVGRELNQALSSLEGEISSLALPTPRAAVLELERAAVRGTSASPTRVNRRSKLLTGHKRMNR